MDFFVYKDALSVDDGFRLFGICHLVWMIGIGIFSWWMGKFFSFGEKRSVTRWKKILGLLLPLLEVSRMLVLIIGGDFNFDEMPLHLCNMALFLVSIYLLTHNRFVGVVYVLLCVPAAILAVVFPGWLRYPFWSYMHIHNFVYHGFLIAVGYALIISKDIVPEWKELWKPLIFGLIGYGVMYAMNVKLGTNFWFINMPSYQSPLAFLYELFGDKWYLLGHFLFCSMVVILWCGVIHVVRNKEKVLNINKIHIL